MSRVLVAGESWLTTATHVKGVDAFSVHSYVEGIGPLRRALEATGHELVHLPAHLVPDQFPETQEQLEAYDVVVLSDIGANSIQLSTAVLERSERGADRLAALERWTAQGGGLMMVGGYLSFTGFEAKAAFRGTPLEPALPVEMLPEDDRVELPAGGTPVVGSPEHPALGGAGENWPHLLGYNRVLPREGYEVLATVNEDPLVAVGDYGKGRTAVFTSDCSPHWAPAEFCEEWPGYDKLFGGLIDWLAG